MTYRIIAVEGKDNRAAFDEALRDPLFEVVFAASVADGLARMPGAEVVLARTADPDHACPELVSMAQSQNPPPAVLVVTEDPKHAVECVTSGAADFIILPATAEEIRRAVVRSAEERQLRLDAARLHDEVQEKSRLLKNAEDRMARRDEILEQKVEKGTQAVLESELRYRELFNLANDAIFTTEADTGRIIDANLEAERLTGYSIEELLSMHVADLHPEDERARATEFEHRMAVGGHGHGLTTDLTFLTRDGTRIILSVSGSMLDLFGQKIIYRICRDVTDVRRMELELKEYTRELQLRFDEKKRALLDSQGQLVQAEKMAALGNLVAGIAHEINTPLASINSNNDIFSLTMGKVQQLLRDHVPSDILKEGGDFAEILSMIDDAIRTNRMACERIVKIVRSLRNFARLDEAERKKADIHEGIESTLTLVSHELKRRIKVTKEYGAIPEIECYPNQLNQVFMNILVNASQAIEGQGEIRIRTWEQDDSVHIAFTDSGKGIPPEILPKVFDPGFTTKKAGVGTGLGLSICYRIIQDHNGRIEVESEVGRGTTFMIILPISRPAERTSNG
jgi:PAS domain S-box-containing protein